jgi:hypothetical protein
VFGNRAKSSCFPRRNENRHERIAWYLLSRLGQHHLLFLTGGYPRRWFKASTNHAVTFLIWNLRNDSPFVIESHQLRYRVDISVQLLLWLQQLRLVPCYHIVCSERSFSSSWSVNMVWYTLTSIRIITRIGMLWNALESPRNLLRYGIPALGGWSHCSRSWMISSKPKQDVYVAIS